MADLPLKFVYDRLYESWINYHKTSDGKYAARFARIPLFGIPWNMRWYKAVNSLVTLPDENAFLEVSDTAKHIPASSNVYQTELDNLRILTQAISHAEINMERSDVYKSMQSYEENCALNCSSYVREFDDTTRFELCNRVCKQPLVTMKRDTDRMITEWRDSALNCMSKHSVATGDRDEGAFDQCIKDLSATVLSYTATNESLCEWIKPYAQMYKFGVDQ
jgi:hypothetical protein